MNGSFLRALLLAACCPAANAAPTWWSLDTMPAGTPPTVQCLTSSTPDQTVLDVTLHGFWYETLTQGQQAFQRLSLNRTRDEALSRQIGRPELPAVHHLLGNLTGGQMQAPSVTPISEVQIPGAVIWPAQPVLMEDQQSGPFQQDTAFYQQTSSVWPAARGAALGTAGRFDGLDLMAAETYPFRVVPATQTLIVTQHYMVAIAHAGTGTPATETITRRRAKQYELALDNFAVVSPLRPANVLGYAGDYLIVTDPLFVEEIEPLADQKRERGYTVLVADTDETGTTCAEIRGFVTDWWSAAPEKDHYVLLVGDTTSVPLCPSERLTGSDILYACVDGLAADGLPDVYPEARLGRFPCVTESECTQMVTKTLTYEDDYDFTDTWLSEVVLACHEEADLVYPDQYRDAQETVRAYPFTSPPSFTTRYGQDGATDAEVRSDVNGDIGLLCYRGHGSSDSWSGDWNLANESFDTFDVGLLTNQPNTPVVFSIACLNNSISTFECIGEKWMKTTGRSVAHFAASHCTSRDANDLLDLELFETIYEDGHRILGEAIAAAHAATMISFPVEGEANAWQYLLLGDPELEVWTAAPPPLFVLADVSEVSTGPTTVVVTVSGSSARSATGVSMATVAVWKDGEVSEALYTDAMGQVSVPVDPQTPGTLTITAYTELGPEGVGALTIPVTGPTAALDVAAAATLRLGPVAPNPSRERVVVPFTLPAAGRAKLEVIDASGRRVAKLADEVAAAGAYARAWNGRGADGRVAAPGVYFLRLTHAGATRTAKVTLVR
ncbi:MAG: C25 family cysteine peptidase [Candidatus Eiseniibacteriota bacterium]